MGTDLRGNIDLMLPGINDSGEKGSKSPVIKITFRVYSGGRVIQGGNDRGPEVLRSKNPPGS